MPPSSEAGSTPSTSSVLQELGQAAWTRATTHPMVTEIGNGSLPHETFRFYFEQNILYLQDYARAIALVIGRSPSAGAIYPLTKFLSQIVEVELPANQTFWHRLGGGAAEGGPGTGAASEGGVRMSATTYAYTRHLLDTASRGDIATALAALLPCQWSYGEIGSRLVTSLPEDPIYADWIGLFAGDGYDELVQASAAVLDAHSDLNDIEQLRGLAEAFDRSTRYEVAFWEMAYTRGASDRS